MRALQVADTADGLREALLKAVGMANVVVTTGGVSNAVGTMSLKGARIGQHGVFGYDEAYTRVYWGGDTILTAVYVWLLVEI